MKIRSVTANNRRRAFMVTTWRARFPFPYSLAEPVPAAADPVAAVFVDSELGREAFTYRLASGREGSVHVDRVLDYNRDPSYLRDMLLYRLTLEARKLLERGSLTKREVIRRLGTSAAQLYRLLDPTNRRKSVDGLLRLLAVLGGEVDLIVRARTA
jgi:hypothetical protein